MCGIVGYVGGREDVQEVLLDGLRKLEYRGYDSAGLAMLSDAGLRIERALGKLNVLAGRLHDAPMQGTLGLGHTRWATHGKPSEPNAHPHRAGKVALVHNGIIENYAEIRAELEAAGRELLSETDTELIAHLIDMRLAEGGSDLGAAVRDVSRRLVGSYGLAVVCEDDPDHIVAAKQGGSPLILGLGRDENFLASDVPAILGYTRQMLFLEDGEFAVLSRDGVQIVDVDGHLVEREPRTIQWDPVSAEKGGYDRFMQKEIFEQPRAIQETIGTRVGSDGMSVDLDGIDLSPDTSKIDRIFLVACGTAYYAASIGKYMIEQMAGIPVEVDLASEFRYRKPIVDAGCLLVPVSQSGETADTLAALREGKEHGARILAITNTRDSSIARESHDVLYTHAGPEIGVASTKCFSVQVVALYLLALKLAVARRRLSADETRAAVADLLKLPRMVEQALSLDGHVREVAQRYFKATNFLFLGRGIMYPIAMEGALKLKEISYIHAEGYAAGEMKHGPIALIDENMPVVVICNRSAVYDKVLSNLEEVRARDGKVIAIASEEDDGIAGRSDAVIRIPELGPYLTALLATIPVQLLAYHVATLKGTDVDQPRNLAKSVTVE